MLNQQEKTLFTPPRLGIIGGGQLGKMLAQEARKLSVFVNILDPSPTPPARMVADHHIVGSFFDETRFWDLAARSDIITCELENIDTELLAKIADAGSVVIPAPAILRTLQDKLTQKEFFRKHQIPTSRFQHAGCPDAEQFDEFGYPLVQKARRGGYDGRGVKVLEGVMDFKEALATDSIIEEKVDIAAELAVIIARGDNGDIRSYPVVEMWFDNEANILDLLLTPARISPELTASAQSLAARTIQALQGVGVYGVEMFLTSKGDLLINEVSPRPHNSGHYTIEACMTSQYEQHLRAICGLPLGSSELLCPAVMVNLLGSQGASGRPVVKNLHKVLEIPGVTVHIYGKTHVSPGRKMGHVIILDKNINLALDKANKIKKLLEISGEDPND